MADEINQQKINLSDAAGSIAWEAIARALIKRWVARVPLLGLSPFNFIFSELMLRWSGEFYDEVIIFFDRLSVNPRNEGFLRAFTAGHSELKIIEITHGANSERFKKARKANVAHLENLAHIILNKPN